MPLNLELFKASLVDGGARASLFQMEINKQGTVAGLNAVPFHVRVSEIPGSTITPIVQKFAGREIKFAGQRTYGNLSVTVLNDENFRVRTAIEDWMNKINAREANVRLAGPTELQYQGDAIVNQFTKTGVPIKAFKFVGLFPVTMAAIPLDWSNDGVIEEYTVEFAYQYWEPTTPSTGAVISGLTAAATA